MGAKEWVLWIIIAWLVFVSLEPPTEEGPYSLQNKNFRKLGGKI